MVNIAIRLHAYVWVEWLVAWRWSPAIGLVSRLHPSTSDLVGYLPQLRQDTRA